jgi:hypothetical protein
MIFASKFLQAKTRYYHGSNKPLKPGTVLTPGKGGGFQTLSHPAFQAHEQAMEDVRPKNRISRQNCIYMCGSPDDVARAGGGSQYIYEVTPKGQVDKSDQAWFGSSDDLSNPESFDAINNYWSGAPYPDSRESLWEYRTRSAVVGGRVK